MNLCSKYISLEEAEKGMNICQPQTQASEKRFSLTAATQNNFMEIADKPVSSTSRQKFIYSTCI